MLVRAMLTRLGGIGVPVLHCVPVGYVMPNPTLAGALIRVREEEFVIRPSMSIIVGQHKLCIARSICFMASQCSRRTHSGLHVCILPLHTCAFIGYWNYEWSLHGFAGYQAASAIWGVLHGFAGCQATSAMGGVRHSAFVPFSHPPPRSKGASVNCKGLQWCTVGSVPLDSPLVWGACFALRTSGVRDA